MKILMICTLLYTSYHTYRDSCIRYTVLGVLYQSWIYDYQMIRCYAQAYYIPSTDVYSPLRPSVV